MRSRVLPVGLVLLLAAGCFEDERKSLLVPDDPFGTGGAPPQATRVSYAPAAGETATRVAALGQKLIAANPQLGLRPMFATIGAPQAEIFHRGTTEVYVTEGLVKKCATEGQLAAVLARELGKLVSEREAQGRGQEKPPDRGPPMEVRTGEDNIGLSGPADQTRLAELAKYEKERRRPAANPAPPPDPQQLARTYLVRAGFQAGELDAAAPALKAAEENMTLEKQLTAPPHPYAR